MQLDILCIVRKGLRNERDVLLHIVNHYVFISYFPTWDVRLKQKTKQFGLIGQFNCYCWLFVVIYSDKNKIGLPVWYFYSIRYACSVSQSMCTTEKHFKKKHVESLILAQWTRHLVRCDSRRGVQFAMMAFTTEFYNTVPVSQRRPTTLPFTMEFNNTVPASQRRSTTLPFTFDHISIWEIRIHNFCIDNVFHKVLAIFL